MWGIVGVGDDGVLGMTGCEMMGGGDYGCGDDGVWG